MLNFALKNLLRRPLRTSLTLLGLAVSIGLLACILSLGDGYQAGMMKELNQMGSQMMMVPIGCPYDAAARVITGRTLDSTLPEAALSTARSDSGVAVASPIFSSAIVNKAEGRTDMWVGVDSSNRILKPWLKLTNGSHWFVQPNDIILGSDAAAAEMRIAGDKFYSPETGRSFTVAGVLQRTGTSDDNLFFVPLATAQAMFHKPGRLTAISIRLKDPSTISDAADRLQKTPGAQVITSVEVMGTFLNLVNAAKTLILAITLVAVTISTLSIFNTMMSSTIERTRELAILRAVGMSRWSTSALMSSEAIMLSIIGGSIGLLIAGMLGGSVQQFVRPFLPLAPPSNTSALTPDAIIGCIALTLTVGLVASLYPAWQAARLQPAVALRMD